MEDYVQDAYFNALIKEGLDASVIEWLAQMAEINDRTPTLLCHDGTGGSSRCT